MVENEDRRWPLYLRNSLYLSMRNLLTKECFCYVHNQKKKVHPLPSSEGNEVKVPPLLHCFASRFIYPIQKPLFYIKRRE